MPKGFCDSSRSWSADLCVCSTASCFPKSIPCKPGPLCGVGAADSSLPTPRTAIVTALVPSGNETTSSVKKRFQHSFDQLCVLCVQKCSKPRAPVGFRDVLSDLRKCHLPHHQLVTSRSATNVGPVCSKASDGSTRDSQSSPSRWRQMAMCRREHVDGIS